MIRPFAAGFLPIMQQNIQEEITAPKNYKPSTVKDRTAWNKFLMFLMDKGYRGSEELDKKDKSLGVALMDEFNKLNPDNKISPEFVPIAQYENAIIRKRKQFPELDEKESEIVSKWLPKSYEQQEISSIDGWLGSKTSKLQYPEFTRIGTDPKNPIRYGADYRKYLSNDNPFVDRAKMVELMQNKK